MLESITSWDNRRRIGRLTWVTAWVTLVLGQLHALARHATEDGKADLDLPLTRAWAEPAARALKPLLDWANPDAVYLTYGKIWFPVFVISALCALAIYRLRQPTGFEKWAWRVSIAGYGAAAVGVFIGYWTQWTGYNAIMDWSLAFDIPGLLLTFFGSTALGLSLLRRGFRPRLSAVLLAVSLPAFFGITEITSMGNGFLPILFALAVAGRRLGSDPTYAEQSRAAALV
jgi:hypothetical protein